MVRQLSQSVSESAVLVGCSRSAVSVYQSGPRNNATVLLAKIPLIETGK